MALLSLIVLGLMAMFSQTQRAFRTGLTQTDVLGSGRVMCDLITRELEQITPTHQNAINFEARYPNYRPLEQPLPGSAHTRTNMVEDLFFVTRDNQSWVGIGYFVRTTQQAPTRTDVVTPAISFGPTPSILSAGTLYRFEARVADVPPQGVPPQGGPGYLYSLYHTYADASFWPLNTTNIAKLMDGVVHFKVRAYNANGAWIVQDWGTNGVSFSGSQINSHIQITGKVPGEVDQYQFLSNAVPAVVELETGILEDKAWQRFKSQPSDLAKYNYVTNVVGRVHLFRQRVQVRNVDPVAYQ